MCSVWSRRIAVVLSLLTYRFHDTTSSPSLVFAIDYIITQFFRPTGKKMVLVTLLKCLVFDRSTTPGRFLLSRRAFQHVSIIEDIFRPSWIYRCCLLLWISANFNFSSVVPPLASRYQYSNDTMHTSWWLDCRNPTLVATPLNFRHSEIRFKVLYTILLIVRLIDRKLRPTSDVLADLSGKSNFSKWSTTFILCAPFRLNVSRSLWQYCPRFSLEVCR